jgi:hypothetical protein
LPDACRLNIVAALSLTRRVALGLMHANQVVNPFHRDGWVFDQQDTPNRMVRAIL